MEGEWGARSEGQSAHVSGGRRAGVSPAVLCLSQKKME